ncbi:putative OsmC-like protein [Crossiella equi]|uniref:OsmC-like protein n=1 Tax=Crossiella equi TaxID=130796 RepID=A0ABS5AMY6_9PSEU|nr:putative OsmC-like protein [Crossiella equi]
MTEVFEATRDAVARDPYHAGAVLDVRASLVPGTDTHVRVRVRGHEQTCDEPVARGGTDVGPNPAEYALSALGSCQVVTYQFWAAKLGIRLTSVSVEVIGEVDRRGFFGLSEHARPGFTGISVRVWVDGPEPRERYEELRREADRHCPVLDLFRAETPVGTELR